MVQQGKARQGSDWMSIEILRVQDWFKVHWSSEKANILWLVL